MALDIKLEVQVKNDISELFIKDITGVQDPNNTGGYGSPNPDRVDFAMVFYGKRIKFEGDPEIVSFATSYVDYDATYDNTHQSLFTLPYSKDGWYQFYLILVPITNGSPTLGDIIYSVSNSRLEVYNGTSFVALPETESDFDALIDGDFDFGLDEDIYQLKLIKQKNCYQEEYFDCLHGCSDCDCTKFFDNVTIISAYIQSIDYTFATTAKFEAVRMLDKANEQFKCCK